MRTMELLEGVEFNATRAHAVPLFVDHDGRILRFTLRPGQSLKEHTAPNSPVYLVILKGRGVFAGGDGKEHELGPNSLVVLDQGEKHSVRALDQDLVFVGFMHGEKSARADRVIGTMAHSPDEPKQATP